eukprot:5771059-Amphidinium_carterae.1
MRGAGPGNRRATRADQGEQGCSARAKGPAQEVPVGIHNGMLQNSYMQFSQCPAYRLRDVMDR